MKRMLSFLSVITFSILCLRRTSHGFPAIGLKSNLKSAKSFTSISSAITPPRSIINPLSATTTDSDILPDDWKFLDAVYLITTDQSDNARLKQSQDALRSCNLLDLVQIRKFKTDDNNRIRGCYTSHMAVLKEIQRQFSNRKQYQVLILEDNIEATKNLKKEVLQSIQSFLTLQNDKGKNDQNDLNQNLWDIFHLAYMMYVPGLKMLQLNRNPIFRSDIEGYSEEDSRRFINEPWSSNIVQMIAEKTSVVGTSAYIVSRNGVEKLLARDKQLGFTDAIPNIMSELFPETRFAAYPMMFHRAGNSLCLLTCK